MHRAEINRFAIKMDPHDLKTKIYEPRRVNIICDKMNTHHTDTRFKNKTERIQKGLT